MRVVVAIALLAAALAAGCVDEPRSVQKAAAVEPEAPAERATPPTPRPTGLPKAEWRYEVLLAADVVLGPAGDPVELTLPVPLETRAIEVNLTLVTGITDDTWIDVDGWCSKTWPGTNRAEGQTIPAYCADLEGGNYRVTAGHQMGYVQARVEARGWVCPAGSECPWWPRAEASG